MVNYLKEIQLKQKEHKRNFEINELQKKLELNL